jgi:hypothetical protein
MESRKQFELVSQIPRAFLSYGLFRFQGSRSAIVLRAQNRISLAGGTSYFCIALFVLVALQTIRTSLSPAIEA